MKRGLNTDPVNVSGLDNSKTARKVFCSKKKRVCQVVRDSTTNQFAMLILEISMAEPLRLDLWASGLLLSNFANT